jgi:Tol biopolymer transport system component
LDTKHTNIYVTNADGTGGLTSLTGRFGDIGESKSAPTWSPDDKKIALVFRGGIYVVNSDGTGKETQLSNTTEGASSLDWSPDGKIDSFRKCRGAPRASVTFVTSSQ